MREKFTHEFHGFHGTPSRCHIQIVYDEKKPLVVLMSQVLTEPGTSIINAYEIIREEISTYLEKKSRDERKQRIVDVIDKFTNTLETTKKVHLSLLINSLKYVSRSFKNNSWVSKKHSFDRSDIIWLQYWQNDAGPQNLKYVLVSENDEGFPSFQHLSIDAFSKRIGYTPQDFAVKAYEIL